MLGSVLTIMKKGGNLVKHFRRKVNNGENTSKVLHFD